MRRIAALLGLLATFAISAPAMAGNYVIYANGGGSCGDGSFTPSGGNLTVQAGESVTIQFVVTEPTYPSGWDIKSSKWSTLHLNSGQTGNVSFTAPSSGSFQYTGTWPSNGCLKATGTITIAAAAQTPPPPPPPAPAASTAKPTAKPATAPTAPPDAVTTSLPEEGAQTLDPSSTGAPSLIDPAKTAEDTSQKNNTVMVAGIAGAALLLGAGVILFLFFIRPKLQAGKAVDVATMASVPGAATAPTQAPASTPVLPPVNSTPVPGQIVQPDPAAVQSDKNTTT